MTHELTKLAARKGWTARQLSARWDITPRTFSRNAASPTQLFTDAVEGVPTRVADIEAALRLAEEKAGSKVDSYRYDREARTLVVQMQDTGHDVTVAFSLNTDEVNSND